MFTSPNPTYPNCFVKSFETNGNITKIVFESYQRRGGNESDVVELCLVIFELPTELKENTFEFSFVKGKTI